MKWKTRLNRQIMESYLNRLKNEQIDRKMDRQMDGWTGRAQVE